MLAHETWFTQSRPPYDWAYTFQALSLGIIAVAVSVAAIWRFIGARFPRPEIKLLRPLGQLAPWVPRLLAVHAGVSLLAQAARETYLAPSLHLPRNGFGAVLGMIEGLIGVWLITGYRIRRVSLLVVLSGPVAMLAYGVVPVLERMDLLGIALFLFLLPPGESHWGKSEANLDTTATALFALRLLVGGSLIVLAFTEKLARPSLAYAFLNRYPDFNLFKVVGLNVADDTFLRMAAGFELLFGLLIISGRLPQLAVIVAGIPFNATLFFLGAEELIGHLPIYGAMLALLIYGSNPQTAQITDRLPGYSLALPHLRHRAEANDGSSPSP